MVNVAQTLEENVTLTVGSQAQTVTVAADALQVQTETSEVSTLISGEQVRNSRPTAVTLRQLAALGLGVSNNLPSFGGVDALTSANGISFNGTRTTHNIYLIDGGEQNDRGCGGCFMNLPSQDAIARIPDAGQQLRRRLWHRFRRHHPDGDQVRHAASITESLYEFNRNTDYNANDYFLKQAGKPRRPEFQLNVPGGNIGGPLFIPHVYNEAKNRTFFFWNEEWRRLIQGSSPSVTNDLWRNNFPTPGRPCNYTSAGRQASRSFPSTTDPAKLALYAADGLTPGQPFPERNGTYDSGQPDRPEHGPAN